MPTPAQQLFSDGSIPFGSKIESIGAVSGSAGSYTISGGVGYYLDNIVLDYGTKILQRPDQIGGPQGFVGTRDQPTGTCVIQVPIGSAVFNSVTGGWDGVAWPTLGMGFVDRMLAAGECWLITKLGIPYEQQGYYKVNASLMQRTQ